MSGRHKSLILRQKGFTIVELLIVIVVITILAAVTIVSYNGISKRAAAVTLQSDLRQIADQLGTSRVDSGSYPLTASITPNSYFKHSDGTNLEYTSTDGTAFCITASSTQAQDNYYFDSAVGKVMEGKCSGHTGYVAGGGVTLVIQTVTSANCPTSATAAIDARDNNTYWVQKLGSTCWMLTNLAYAGGGTNTYGDVIPTGSGTPGSPKGTLNGPDNTGSTTYTLAKYYIPTGANPTQVPASPSTDQTGGGSGAGRQYGYLYNWCAAMGGQATAACANATTPTTNSSTSICPAGWRLPTSNGGDFTALNTSINGGLTTASTGLLTNGYFQYSGFWGGSFINTGSNGDYWSNTSSTAGNSYRLYFDSASTDPKSTGGKLYGFAVRCVAN